jgi:hypothetical protein
MNCYQHKLTLNTWNETEFLVLQTRGSVFRLLIKINRKETSAGEPTALAARRVFSASIPTPATCSVAVNSGSWRAIPVHDPNDSHAWCSTSRCSCML